MKKEIDMVNGKLLPEMTRFAIPIILSSVMQTLYNAADSLVIGRYGSSNALGAVGSAGPIVNIILSLFLGFAVGTNVLAARYFGAGDKKMVKSTSDTSIVLAVISGVITAIFGILIAEPIVELVKIDPAIKDMTAFYMQIYFIGLPFTALYNFVAATIRAMGDTKNPMICLIVSGMVNVVLNVIFVKGLSMGVEGVAIPTVISQIVSSIMILAVLKKTEIGFSLKKLNFSKKLCLNTIKIGLPAGVQGMVFNLSNTITVSAINSFGAAAAAANTVAGQVEGMVYVAMNSVTQTVTTFTSQNLGANKIKRLNPIMFYGFLLTGIIGIVFPILAYIFKAETINIFSPGDAEVAKYAIIKYRIVLLPYILVALMEIPSGMLKGMKATTISMLMTIIGVCGFRITWQLIIFPIHRTLDVLYMSYPISWFATGIAYLIAYVILKKKLNRIMITD